MFKRGMCDMRQCEKRLKVENKGTESKTFLRQQK